MWKDVLGFKGYYSVNESGIVRSNARQVPATSPNGKKYTKTVHETILKPIVEDGYYRVTLSQGGKYKKYTVHRIVLSAFNGASNLNACHKDGNRLNNSITNLYWGTTSQNTLDAVRHGTFWQTRKTKCPMGHEFREGNLVKAQLRYNKRQCLSCVKAKIYLKKHKGSLKQVSDKIYENLIKV